MYQMPIRVQSGEGVRKSKVGLGLVLAYLSTLVRYEGKVGVRLVPLDFPLSPVLRILDALSRKSTRNLVRTCDAACGAPLMQSRCDPI